MIFKTWNHVEFKIRKTKGLQSIQISPVIFRLDLFSGVEISDRGALLTIFKAIEMKNF